MTTAQVVETSVTVNNNSPIQVYVHPDDQTQPTFNLAFLTVFTNYMNTIRGTQRQFSENICSEYDLRSRIFGTFFVKFLACLPLVGFSNI